MPKISIAVTTYNGEKYIYKQLASLNEQTRMADEVVICDDCSTDNTKQIVENFIKDNNLCNWSFSVNQQNIGYKKNFYQAISKTTGDITFLCDQDDIWHKTKLEELEKLMKDETVMAVSSSFVFIDSDDKIINVKDNKKYSNHNLIKFKIENGALEKIEHNVISKYNISPGCTTAFKNKVKKIYLNESRGEIVHDYEINYIAACLGGLYFYNKALIDYRIHNNNTIGLGEIVGGVRISERGSYNARKAKAETLNSYYEILSKYCYLLSKGEAEEFSKQRNFVKDRYDAYHSKSIAKILRLYRYGKVYVQSVTLKGRIMDVVAILLPTKKLED